MTREKRPQTAVNRFALAHVFSAISDALVTVSLADSLFFSVSPDASREQVLLYLAITMAPFALLVPLIGPTVDRFHTGHRWIAVILYLLRAITALALAAFIHDLGFYLLALLMLIFSRAASVLKQALVPSLVESPDRLVAANSRFALMGTIGAAIGGAIGGGLLAVTSTVALLVAACVSYVLATIVMLGVRVVHRPSVPLLDEVEYQELHVPAIVAASNIYIVIRGLVGYFVFGLAFALRRDSEPAWVYVAAVAAYGAGVFLANVTSPLIRRRVREELMMVLAVAVLGVFSVLGAVGPTRQVIIAVSGVLGLSVGIGRQAFDAMVQRRARLAVRGRAFARFETRFQLGWVAGGALATGLAVSIQVNMAVVAAVLLPAMVVYLRHFYIAQRLGASETPDPLAAARRHLGSATEWLAHGSPRHAAVELAAGIDVLRLSDVPVPPDVSDRSAELRRHALDGNGTDVDADDVGSCLAELGSLVEPGPAPW